MAASDRLRPKQSRNLIRRFDDGTINRSRVNACSRSARLGYQAAVLSELVAEVYSIEMSGRWRSGRRGAAELGYKCARQAATGTKLAGARTL